LEIQKSRASSRAAGRPLSQWGPKNSRARGPGGHGGQQFRKWRMARGPAGRPQPRGQGQFRPGPNKMGFKIHKIQIRAGPAARGGPRLAGCPGQGQKTAALFYRWGAASLTFHTLINKSYPGLPFHKTWVKGFGGGWRKTRIRTKGNFNSLLFHKSWDEGFLLFWRKSRISSFYFYFHFFELVLFLLATSCFYFQI